jgi:hypothetical protein
MAVPELGNRIKPRDLEEIMESGCLNPGPEAENTSAITKD